MFLRSAARSLDISRIPTDSVAGRRLAIERLFYDGFENLVDGLSVEEVAVPFGSPRLPRTIGHFALIPIVADSYSKFHDSRMPMLEEGVKLPARVRFNGINPDTALTIGLTRDNELIGVASAYVPDPKDGLTDVLITTIQGNAAMDGTGDFTDAGYRTGLHGGVDWKRTLVEAWRRVALLTPAESLGILSSVGHPWAKRVGQIRASREPLPEPLPVTEADYMALGAGCLKSSLDDVANACGFEHHPSSSALVPAYWELSLQDSS